VYYKNALIFVLLLISNITFGQIKIDDVGDGWKSKVDSAISLIKLKDSASYQMLIENCKDVEFIISDRSSTKPPYTIAITTKDMGLNSINNIAAILVHESYHLYIWNKKIKLTPKREEWEAYTHEYVFLCKLDNVEDWLFLNAVNQIIKHQ
jgi:hypothetical protein